VGVKYVIFWSDGQVNRVLSRVIVSDVPLDTPVKQMFEIVWANLPPTYDDVFNFDNVNTVEQYDNIVSSLGFIKNQRSGIYGTSLLISLIDSSFQSKKITRFIKTGYQIGKPLITGILSNSDVDVSYASRVAAFKIVNNNKLCGQFSSLERQLLDFNRNISTSCIVQITREDLVPNDKCECLRRMLFNKLNDYFAPSNVVSKNGNPATDTFNKTDWIDIYPLNRNLLKNATTTYDTFLRSLNLTIDNVCLNVPYKLNVWFFFEKTGSSHGLPIYEIVGSYVR
jgi:hypothetical protein